MINKCGSSSMKILSNGQNNGEIKYHHSKRLICESSTTPDSPPPTSPDVDDQDEYLTDAAAMVTSHLDVNSSSTQLSPGGGRHCYFSGILPSPPSCGDSFKSVSSPESECTALPDDEHCSSTTALDHHISSLCSLTVPKIFDNDGDGRKKCQIDDDVVKRTAKEQTVLENICKTNGIVRNSRTLNDDDSSDRCDVTDRRIDLDDAATSRVRCKWNDCNFSLEESEDIVDHIQESHVKSQLNSGSVTKYVCLWNGCKVFDKPSSNRRWLERHVMSHGGQKPFKCIVDGCGSRFTSKNALERHVNSHFKISQHSRSNSVDSKRESFNCSSNSNSNSNGGGGGGGGGGKSSSTIRDDTPNKSRKRRHRYKRLCWTANTEDFFDFGIMEHVRHRLELLNSHTKIDIDNTGNCLTFRSQVIAKRTEESGKVEVLLHWHPENVIPDSWESEKDVKQERNIPVRSLPHDVELTELLSLSPVANHRRKVGRKRKRIV